MSFFSWFRTSHQNRSSQAGKSAREQRSFRPKVESLEERALMNAPQTTPFAFLAPGFTQETYAVAGSNFLTGVAFASNGDPLVSNESQLIRFDSHSTVLVNGTLIHPQVGSNITVANSNNSFLGLTNNPDGTIYINSGGGVLDISASTGAYLRGPTPGAPTGVVGIATDPQTGNLVYLGSGGLDWVNPAFTQHGVFLAGQGGDGIAFDPTGNFLFVASGGGVDIIKRDGPNLMTATFVQHVADSDGSPDGIAFAAGAQKFVITNNGGSGTMSRFDFPGNDFTKVPVVTTFASGGQNYGDHMQVGPDGYLYLTHDYSTFYKDGTQTAENSLVRIGPGFAPPPGVSGAVNLSHSVVFVNQLKPRSPRTAVGYIALTNNTNADIVGDFTFTFSLPPGASLQSITDMFPASHPIKASGFRNGQYYVTFSGGLKKGAFVEISMSLTYSPYDSLDGIRKFTDKSISAATGD